jgi:Kdo2-lipid IVA lauroyltransferase/acyltransferase
MGALLVRLLLGGLSRLPLPLLHRLGRGLGWLLFIIDNDLRRTANTNIRHCFAELSAQQQQQLVAKTLQQTAMAAFEAGKLWLRPAEQVLPLVTKVSGQELVEQALATGKGLILAGPHFGAWEMVGIYASRHWSMTSLYRPPRQAALGKLMREGRERVGATLVPLDGSGIRVLYKALSRGELTAILPDQDPDLASGIFAPFFGVPANTMTLLSRLASKSGATVLIAYAERLPQGTGYHLHFKETAAGIADKDATKAVLSLNHAIEDCVRQCPEQYQWTYKRFKTRPEGKQRFYS